jgi:hypothetical protein
MRAVFFGYVEKTLLSNFRALGLAPFDKRAAASFFVVSNRLDFLG